MTKKKTAPFITAAEARLYVPQPDPTGVYAKIDYAVKQAVSLGRSVIDLTTIVGQPHSGAWMTGKPSPYVQDLAAVLEDAGYTIQVDAGSNAARGYINLSWPERDHAID
ncbi:hypothetical protein KIKIMORA_04270 [Brevundimonas phage vB_BpoS-Kikimora]|uniref:Uncharacterized protein n=1 Tax=Brevundimonas phage vB_BpoS-Kikimora TaxID=2948601 RepID=A0A9E7MT14_9CAUD|nr:hypothetical protein KIKIMORA_04270 [Brevundimonas phage vB_BpoS-Kikimora]